MSELKETWNRLIREADSICILGHISPDGDCVGSTLGVYNYIRSMERALSLPKKRVDVRLEEASAKFAYLNGFDEIRHETDSADSYALAIVCDCGDAGRLGKYYRYLQASEHSFCADHHATNRGFAEQFLILPDASSTCEVLYDLMEEAFIDRNTAECIYTGIVHDTGVFRYSSTSQHTMEIAGKCMSFGFDFGSIIDDSFFSMSVLQKQVLGRVLMEARTFLDGRVIVGSVSAAMMKLYGVTSKDMDGVIDELRTTRGAVMAVFLYQTPDRRYKVSLRSNSDALNVAAIAQCFGGGGHVKAAGCFLGANLEENIEKILAEAKKQIG